MKTKQHLIDAVKAHALKHYNDGGWDFIVECWSDEEIAECFKDAETEASAIAAVGQIVSVYADRQADAKNSAF